MVRRASNSAVSEIEVEVDSPADRGRKKDNDRSNPASDSVSGSGTSGTLKANNSSGEWYLEHVTGYALGATTTGVIAGKIQVKNDSGAVKKELHDDFANGFFVNFHGSVVKPGETIDYVVEQSDSNSYTTEFSPLIRKPNPDTPTTVETSNVIDSFEDGGITEYSGNTGDFSVVDTESYHLDYSLECSAPGGGTQMYSTTGLDTYPERGDTFSARVLANSTDGSVDPRIGVLFGVQDSNNYYAARVNYGDQLIIVRELDGGSQHIVAQSDYGDTSADQWDKLEVDWGSTVTVKLQDGLTDDTVMSVSFDHSEFNNQYTDGGFGWDANGDAGVTVRADNAVIEP